METLSAVADGRAELARKNGVVRLSPRSAPKASAVRNLLLGLLLAWLAQSCGAAGFLRYGLTQARPGNLHRGIEAPDVELVSLNGERLRLSDLIGERPLVLVFGSYT